MSAGGYYVYWRVTNTDNPWSKAGPMERSRANQWKNHQQRVEGRQARMINIKEGESSSPSDMIASGRLPK